MLERLMMNKEELMRNDSGRVICTFALALTIGGTVSPGSAQAECSDFVLHLKDSAAALRGEDAREIDMYVNCHEGSYQFPAATTLQIYEFDREGRFCSSWKSCGNVSHWKVDAGAAVGFSIGQSITHITDRTRVKTVGDALTYIDSQGQSHENTTGRSIHVTAGIDFGDVNRYCSESSIPVCW